MTGRASILLSRYACSATASDGVPSLQKSSSAAPPIAAKIGKPAAAANKRIARDIGSSAVATLPELVERLNTARMAIARRAVIALAALQISRQAISA
jgi:hypothetical protein